MVSVVRSELALIIDIPVPCGNCGKEFAERAARLLKITEIACPACNAVLSLDAPEWATFRQGIEEFSVGKFSPVTGVKQLPKRG